MYNYLELAVRLDNLVPKIVDSPSEVGCQFAYADARSLFRDQANAGGHVYTDERSSIDNPDSQSLVRRGSVAAEYGGQAILEVKSSPTEMGMVLAMIHDRFQGRDIESFVRAANAPFDLGNVANGGIVYGLSRDKCTISPNMPADNIVEPNGERLYLWAISDADSNHVVNVTCDGLVGEVKLTFPHWIGK
jgi:hypothetical protein